jgi:GNAT superfamily N-acetyltransferase
LSSEPSFTIRPARAMDKDTVLAFCAHTFADGDYLPEVWDEWLADSAGQLLVGVLNEVPVGVAKVTMLTPTEAWLEGLRVNPSCRRSGLGWQFHIQCLHAARSHGAEVARLATSSKNMVVHKMAERTGMFHVASCLDMIAPGLPPEEGRTPLVPLNPDNWTHVAAPVLRSTILAKTHGLYGAWCRWQALTETKLRAHLAQGQVLSLPCASGAVDGLAITLETRWESLPVAFVDGAGAGLEALALALRRHAACVGLTEAEVMIPDDAELRQAFERAGYRSDLDPESALWIYEIDWTGALP